MSPSWHCSTAAWIMRLSPGRHRAVTAVPAMRTSCWTGRNPGPRLPVQAHALVDGGHAVAAQCLDVLCMGARRVGDDQAAESQLLRDLRVQDACSASP